jgi:hypothetical protein
VTALYSMPAAGDEFEQAHHLFEKMNKWLKSDEALGMTHEEIEERLTVDGQELQRLLYQAHLYKRSRQEIRHPEVVGSDGRRRTHVEPSQRPLMTVFGPVQVPRLAYRGRGLGNLHPADGQLNLPPEKHSHGLRRRVAEEVSRGSYDEAVSAVDRWSAGHVAKRQAEELAQCASQDFDAFYAQRAAPAGYAARAVLSGMLLVLSMDGKGIVMRPEALTEATKKAAQQSRHKLGHRLSKGEKKGRKRMATVASVYDIEPWLRRPQDVMGDLEPVKLVGLPRPRPQDKRVWASVSKDACTVTKEVFAEAHHRDPGHLRHWIVLVDGDRHQIARIEAAAKDEGVSVTLVVDFIHVLQYLWKAAWCFFSEGDPAAEAWVKERALLCLAGKSSDVAAGVRRSATLRGLSPRARGGADECADYLLAKRPYLHYDRYLALGLPIATGVIEGACRHLVKDRMDLTGARWGLAGAEAVLRLRSLRSSGDWDDYWCFHLDQEQERHHRSRYADHLLPRAA